MSSTTNRSLEREQVLRPLNFVVEYKGSDARPGIAPGIWTAMAAFDVEAQAESYAALATNYNSDFWQYRVVDVTPKDDNEVSAM